MKNLLIAFAILFSLGACKSKQAISTPTPTSSQERVGNRSSKERPARNQGERKQRPKTDQILKMDTNKDGKLAKSETKGKLLERFSTIDADGDGFITRTELENAPKPKRVKRPPRQN